MEKLDPLEYALNRMEAERDKPPPTLGYPAARKELLDGISSLRTRLSAAEKRIVELEKVREAAEAATDHHKSCVKGTDLEHGLIEFVRELENKLYVLRAAIEAAKEGK